MITQDDIDAFDERVSPVKPTKVNAGIAQYLMRQAFEEGFRAVYGDTATKEAWFPHWLASQTRAMLIANGLITGKEGYK